MSTKQKLVVVLCCVMVAYLATGCSTAQPYGRVSLGYKVKSDYWIEPEHGGGRNPTVHLELGIKWNTRFHCAYNHWSHLRDGGPFNDNPEAYKDELLCGVGFGSGR